MPDSNLTELDAVNSMLLTIGEQKVNSLDSAGVLEVDVAKATLAEVSRAVQSEGWDFNTEHHIRLLPATDGYISLPSTCIRAWTHPRSRPQVAQRGVRLYNKTDHSYLFTGPIRVSLLTYLAFDELIPAARQYISLRASRRFQERLSGSQITEEFVMREEGMARIALEAADAFTGGYNLILDNEPTGGAARRDRR